MQIRSFVSFSAARDEEDRENTKGPRHPKPNKIMILKGHCMC